MADSRPTPPSGTPRPELLREATPSHGTLPSLTAPAAPTPSMPVQEPAAPAGQELLTSINEIKDDIRKLLSVEERILAEQARLKEADEVHAHELQALWLAFRRLEQRQAGTDEDQRVLRKELEELREDLRKDREERTREREERTTTFEAMSTFVQASTKANTDAVNSMSTSLETSTRANAELVTTAVDRFDKAANAHTEAEKAAERAAADHREATKTKEESQDVRLEKVEKIAGLIVEELGIDEKSHADGQPARGRIRAFTRDQKITAAIIVAVNITGILYAAMAAHH